MLAGAILNSPVASPDVPTGLRAASRRLGLGGQQTQRAQGDTGEAVTRLQQQLNLVQLYRSLGGGWLENT